MRLTCFATNTTGTPIAAPQLRHCRRAGAEDRTRAARAHRRPWTDVIIRAVQQHPANHAHQPPPRTDG